MNPDTPCTFSKPKMVTTIEELAFHKTRLGDLTLRRRPEPFLRNSDIFEVKLGDEFLMSSLFVEGERELANLGLAGLGTDLSVVVGGLGLGYTAEAVLEHANVSELIVIDIFPEVIRWHEEGLVPVGTRLADDARCKMVSGDFFELARTGFETADRTRKFDAVLLDIDHSPKHFLDDRNESFYGLEGLKLLRTQLKNDGIFALWSTDLPDETFLSTLESVFGIAEGHVVEFANPYTKSTSFNSVYVARTK